MMTLYVAWRLWCATVVGAADVGERKAPFFSLKDVCRRNLRVAGVDIDVRELAKAPVGVHDYGIVTPIENHQGVAVHDFVIA